MSAPFLLAVMGPTGAGKTAVAENLAENFDAQLLNADAFQVYRGMDVGTAKPGNKDRYRLLDLKDPNESYGLGEFVRLAHAELTRLFEQKRNVIVVGGTGLYIRALFEEYEDMSEAADPELRQSIDTRLKEHGLQPLVEELRTRDPSVAEAIDLRNPVRVTRALERISSSAPRIRYALPGFNRIKFALLPDQGKLNESIVNRHRNMMQNGWVQEVKRLLLTGYDANDPGFRAIGYRQWVRHLEGDVGLEESTKEILAETKRYARRQRTWIRSEPNVTLIDPESSDAVLEIERQLRTLTM